MNCLFGRLTALSVLGAALTFLFSALPPQPAAAQQEGIVLFDLTSAPAPGITIRRAGWAMKTTGGWTGVVTGYAYGTARADLPGAAVGLVLTVPKGSPGTINHVVTPAGVRVTTANAGQVFDGEVRGSSFTLKVRLQQSENAQIWRIGDVWTLTGSWVTGQAVLAIPVSDGRVLTEDLKGNIIRGYRR